MLTTDDGISICNHMNEDHADAILSYAHRFGHAPDAVSATMKAIDSSGMDLEIDGSAGKRTLRIAFDHDLRDAGDARDTLIAMARAAS